MSSKYLTLFSNLSDSSFVSSFTLFHFSNSSSLLFSLTALNTSPASQAEPTIIPSLCSKSTLFNILGAL